MSTLPKPNDVIEITKAAGVAVHPMLARVVRVSDRTCWEGWAELEVAEIHQQRVASAPRMAYVCLDGIRVVRTAETARQTRDRVLKALNGGDRYTLPRPRTSPEATTGRTR